MVGRGRILALDYGIKNVGIAYSDQLGITVRPLASLRNRNRRDLIHQIRAAVRETGAQELVVGIPLNMNGTSGESVHRVGGFIEILRSEMDLPVNRVDERLSTVEALDIWHSMNLRQRRKYRTVDSLAAAFILERFLEET